MNTSPHPHFESRCQPSQIQLPSPSKLTLCFQANRPKFANVQNSTKISEICKSNHPEVLFWERFISGDCLGTCNLYHQRGVLEGIRHSHHPVGPPANFRVALRRVISLKLCTIHRAAQLTEKSMGPWRVAEVIFAANHIG